MQIISPLYPFPGVNYACQTCCDSEIEFLISLSPGEADFEIGTVAVNTSPCNCNILQVGGVSYSLTPGTNVFTPLVQNFILTQGNQLSIKISVCPCAAPGTTFPIQIDLLDALGPNVRSISYQVYSLDMASYYQYQILETSATFNDCIGECDVKKDLLHFTNVSTIPLPVTATLSTACNFNFFIDGNPIDITNFQMPPNASVLQISNPGCVVTAPCNFTIDFDFCGNILSIPITHDLAFCGSGGSGCSIDCQGITIATNPVSMPKYTYGPDYVYDALTTTSNWAWNPYPSTNPTVTQTSTYQEFLLTVGGSNTFDIYYSTSNISGVLFPPLINPGDHATIYWKIETKDVIGSGFEIVLRTNFLASPTTIIVPAGSVTSNTIYQGTIDVPSWIDIMGSNEAFITINNTSATPGDKIQIASRYLQAQQYQKPNLLTTANLDCSTLNDYNTTSIGDSKTATFQLYYANEFKDYVRVWFNPWMFDATADFLTKYGNTVITEPQSGWVADVMTSWIGAGPQPMAFSGPNNQLNYRCYINIIDQHEFEIIFDFFLIQDLKDWVDLYDIDNRRKLVFTENTPLAPYLLNVSNSVYLNQKAMGYLIYIYDPNVIVGSIGTPPKPIYCECFIDRKVMFDVRWWNQGLNGGLPEMSNPTFSYIRNSNPVTELSTINPTDVTFTVFYPNTIDNAVFWLFDESNTDNSIDFYANYDSSRALIPTITTPGVIDNHLESPSQAVTAIGGGYYSVSCRIGTGVNPNGSYRLGAICYSSTADVVNSFLSDPLSVKSVPDVNDICCPLDVDVHWLDYMTDHNTSCFMPTLKERIRNRMYIEGGAFNDCLITLGMPSGTSWIDYLNTFALIIYQRRDNYPTINDRTYFIYDQMDAYRDTSISGNWNYNSSKPLVISDDGTTIYSEWGGRVLWNDTPLPGNKVIKSDMTNWFDFTPVSVVQGNQYVAASNVTYNWADKDIYFQYMLVFDLSSFIPGATSVTLAQINQLHPMDYDSNTNPYGQILDTITITGWKDGTPTTLVGSFCADKYDYLEVEIQETGVLDGKLIATLNYQPYTEYTIKEHESYASTSGASQMIDVEMYDVDSDFVGGVAKFKIDTSLLQAGNYQICAIRLPN